MEKLTSDKILELLKPKISEMEFGYGDYDDEKLGLGEIREISQHGGEDQGSDWYSVKYFVDHDVYIKISGYYSSYDGVYFDQGMGCEVRPQKKTITVYE